MGTDKPTDHVAAHREVTILLTKRHLAEALDLLHQQCQKQNLSDLASVVSEIIANYTRLLQYMKSGTNDPTRKEQLDALFVKAWAAADRLKQGPLLVDAQLSDQITSQMIAEFRAPIIVQDMERDEKLGALFARIKSCLPLSREIRQALHELMLDEQLPQFERATILSAIMLNLFQQFDATMLEQVYTYTLDDQPAQIRVQALITLVLCGKLYDNRISYEPRLRELYQLLIETESDMLTAIQTSLVFCLDTPKFKEKLYNVVKVEIGKVRSGQKPMTFKEFLSLFQDGVDHEYQAFSHFCSHSFFSEPKNEHHWLMPYSTEQPKIRELSSQYPDAASFLKLMGGSLAQCNTSKYFHLLVIEKQLSSVVSQLKDQLQDLPIAIDDIAEPDEFSIQRNYMHDLFRYAELHPKGKSMQLYTQLFFQPSFSDYDCLRGIVDDPDRLERLCRMFFNTKQWDYADLILMQLTRVRISPEILEMQITAAENSQNYQMAEEAFSRYRSLYSFDDKHYLRLARVYENTRRFVNEEVLLHEALKLYPQSAELKIQMVSCLSRQRRHSEALSILHCIQLPKDSPLLPHFCALLAMSLLMLGQYTEAEEQIQAGLSASVTEEKLWALGVFTALKLDDIHTACQRFNRLADIAEDGDALDALMDYPEPLRCLGDKVRLLTLLHDNMRLSQSDSPSLL